MFKFSKKHIHDTSVEAYAACICNCALASCLCACGECECLGTTGKQKLATATFEVNYMSRSNSNSEGSTVAGH